MRTLDIEVTDTFGGEANYCWVRRYSIEVRDSTSTKQIVRRVKREIGWEDWCRVHVENYGDDITLRPTLASGVNQICFVTERVEA
ncbi:hypothetical protein AMP1_4 [Burkholderia phage AMP1]|uniref:Uncharacterized protein n=1 Tax=Burkholderia phage AMP1 TaxID=2601683 RepID=A0A5C2IBP5_9CAUD|nr:hypothetical protein AMP1_4 [Burkholderia phage AMP1]